MITTYEKGANRDTRNGKVSYVCRNPLVEQSFAKYMQDCSVLEDGTYRDMRNWWKGMSLEDDFESLLRHVEDLNALMGSWHVYKERKTIDGTKYEYTHYSSTPIELKEGWREVFIEESLNAIRFNAGVTLLDYLTKNEN